MLPIVVIAGFLGSGKTTVINYLLANPEGKKLAVIVNDIGALNIDDELISSATDNRIALTNGCICCSLKSDLFDAVVELAEGGQAIDAVIVEASGISHPRALVASLKLLEGAGIAHADVLAYLVDASAFAELDYDQAEAVLEHAVLTDLIVVTKSDLADDKARLELNHQLDLCAENVERIEVEFGQLPLSLLLAVEARDADKFESNEPGDDHHGYTQQTITHSEPISRARFDAFVDKISNYAWRAKGFVYFSEAPQQAMLFNMVGSRASLQVVTCDNPDTRLVVIGRQSRMPDNIAL